MLMLLCDHKFGTVGAVVWTWSCHNDIALFVQAGHGPVAPAVVNVATVDAVIVAFAVNDALSAVSVVAAAVAAAAAAAAGNVAAVSAVADAESMHTGSETTYFAIAAAFTLANITKATSLSLPLPWCLPLALLGLAYSRCVCRGC